MTDSPATAGDDAPTRDLLDLAAAWGVATDYWDWQGRHTPVSAPTIRTILGALGVDAATDEATAAALRDAALRPWRRTLPPIVVTRQGWTREVPVHVPDGTPVTLVVELEDGGTRPVRQVDRWVDPRDVDGVRTGEATFELDADLPLGWHVLRAVADGSAGAAEAAVALVVAPQRLELPASVGERAWGVMTQLYQVRSLDSWGVGDLGDLATLAEWSARDLGADFVLVNPLHAAEPVSPMEPSPYLPTTRRFANPLYLRVEELPSYAALGPERRRAVDELAEQARRLSSADRIERDPCWDLKRAALWLLFTAEREAGTEAGLDAYLEERGAGLTDFATWCAIAEQHPGEEWPADLSDARSAEVARFRSDNAERVRFHAWLQWQLARQLEDVQARARAAGMGLGVVHDLAVGVHPAGADAWSLRGTLATRINVGAPPDQFNQLGQDWSQPPWHPVRLAEAGYAPYRDLVRSLLTDAGGLRIDHVIGLFRLWWVPQGRPASEGAYVHYDHEALLSILVLEAHRAGAVVVGEDLGVVEPRAREALLERGILGTSVLWFEWEGDSPRAPEAYRELCLATVTTHDLAPSEGYLQLAHVELREALSLLTRPVEEERSQELASIEKVRAMLVDRGLLADTADLGTAEGREEAVVALHRFLAATPARMLGVALSDMVGDRRIINQPGTSDEYPNWRVPLAGPDERPLLLEDVMGLDLPRRIADVL
jgi:4-alpha-glucanotransferase